MKRTGVSIAAVAFILLAGCSRYTGADVDGTIVTTANNVTTITTSITTMTEETTTIATAYEVDFTTTSSAATTSATTTSTTNQIPTPSTAKTVTTTTTIEQGLNGVTEVTLLNFDQSEFGSRLYDLFLALRTTLQTISKVSDMDNSNEITKVMVIDCLHLINDINTARDKNITYHILDSDKEYINSFRVAEKRSQKENIQ